MQSLCTVSVELVPSTVLDFCMSSVNPGELENHSELLVGGAEAAVRRQHMH